MITALTPEALIHGRVAAFMQNDFRAIFNSYHPDAPFLCFFPNCNAYITYAVEEIANTFQISDCRILRTCHQGEVTDVLFRLRMIHKGEVFDSLEIGRCRRNDHGNWAFEAGLRLDVLKLPDDPLLCSWDLLIAAGNDLWI